MKTKSKDYDEEANTVVCAGVVDFIKNTEYDN